MPFDFPYPPTLGQVYQGYTWDGEKWTSLPLTPNSQGGVIGIQVFPASGVYTPSAAMTTCVIEVVGGGGGGGGVPVSATNTGATGGGGASGSFASLTATAAQISPSQVVTIGAGGAGGAAGVTNGVAGNSTSVGTLCIAPGGGGGNGQVASATSITPGGIPAAGGTGTVVATGAPGQTGATVSGAAVAGNGGSSYFGGGARGAGSAVAASAGTTGGGGAGAWAYNGSAAAAGGKGGDGLVVITEYGMIAPSNAASQNVIRSYLAGLTLSTAGSSATFSVAAGVAADSGNAVMLNLFTAMSKTTGTWAVGSGTGALDIGVIAAANWYHVFLIRRPDTGVVDVLVSLSPTAPTLPANYTQFRRIGSMLTAASQWVAFSQLGDEFLWVSPPADISITNLNNVATLFALTVPTSIQVNAIIRGLVNHVTVSTTFFFQSPDETSIVAGSVVGSYQANIAVTNALAGIGQFSIRTNTNGQIRVSCNTAGSTGVVRQATVGWIDRRGRDG